MDSLRRIMTVLLVGIIVFPVFDASVLAEGAEVSVPDTDQVIVKIKEGTINTLEDSSEMNAFGADTEQRVTLKVPEDETLETFMDDLEKRPDIESVEPDHLLNLSYTPNDPYLSSHQYHHQQIQTNRAWVKTKGSADLTVAVIDNGIDLDHEDLKGQISSFYDVVAGSSSTIPFGEHGTHVAGIISSSMDNEFLGAGVAPNTKLMPINVFVGEIAYTSYVIEGIYHAVDHGADIINMSVGNYNYNSYLDEAIQYAYENNVLLVASAGNDSTDEPAYPASYENVISVGATTEDDSLSFFSNFGPHIDITAPGSDIYSTLPGNSFGAMSGTSMASPIVTGVAALIWSVEPHLSNEEVAERLFLTAEDLGSPGFDPYFGNGRVNAKDALQIVDWAAPQVDAVSENSLEITGIIPYEIENAKVTVYDGSQNILAAITGISGLAEFSVKIPHQKAGAKLSVSVTDEFGNESERAELVVKEVMAPRILEVEKVTDKSGYIAGIAESGSIITVKVGSTTLGTVTVDKDGKFSMVIPLQKAGTRLSLITTDQAGNTSEPIEITVQGEKIEETNTSRLGHLKSTSVKIYPELGNESSAITAGTTYTHAVYYIKKEARLNGQTYYLLSHHPSSTTGVVGWAKAEDMTTHPHRFVDKQDKIFYLKGTGSAYTKAWGGRKDFAVANLSSLKNREFKVNLTETVGSNVWYRGTLDGRTVWIHSSYVTELEQSITSQLGHIRSTSVKIYPELGNESSAVTAGTTYTHAVYYIKKEARLNGQTYYLLSHHPSSTTGVVGWAKAEDMTTHPHRFVDKQDKIFYLKGTGSAYTKAWGGRKDFAVENLSSLKNREFKVNLTETVGSNVWYRGTLDGRTVWIHSSYVTELEQSITSQLGHIRSTSVKIYPELGNESSTVTAGTTYTHAVYYIKKEAVLNGQTYYLLSHNASSTTGVVGWAKAEDMSTHPHRFVDKQDKIFYLKGTGSAYTKAWGGRKDFAVADLSSLKNREFKVHLTETVGSNVWYRGTLNGKTVWIHQNFLSRR